MLWPVYTTGLCVNRLSLNPNKTKYIVFNPHKRHLNQEHLDMP